MKLKVYLNGEATWIYPTSKWQNLEHEAYIDSLRVDPDFYVGEFQLFNVKAEGQSFPKK